MDTLDHNFSVQQLMAPVLPYLNEKVTDACINRPCEMYIEYESAWHRVLDERLTLAWAEALVLAAATAEGKQTDRANPFLSAALPHDLRLHAVLPPACKPGRVILTFRKALPGAPDISRLVSMDSKPLHANRAKIQYPGRADSLSNDLREAVARRCNIAVVGDTGSGKTTVLRSLLLALAPGERVITLEDTDEMRCRQPNAVSLLFGSSPNISASKCVAEILRMRPDRIIVGELRGGEAYDFLKALTSGHKGSMASFHAPSCDLAMNRLALLAKAHPDTVQMPIEGLCSLAEANIDCVIHVDREDGEFGVRDMRWLRR